MISVQVLRAVAALSIVFCHFNYIEYALTGRINLAFPLYNLASGVDLFFVISGFIMVYSSEELFGAKAAWYTFLRRRLTRIIPIYWIATALAFTFIATQADSTQLLTSLLFIPYRSQSSGFFPVHAGGWTLNLEMFFYGIFSCTLFLRRDVAVPVACGALISLIAVGKMAAPEFGPFQVWTDPIMLEFVFGMLIALLYRHNIALPWFARAALIAAGACAVWLFAVPGTVPTTGMRWLYWGVPAAAIFAGVTLGKPVNFGWLTSPLKIIGDSSYALYLFHSMVGAAVIIYWGTLSRYPLYKTLAVAIVVAILLAITIYHLIERPFLRLTRRVIGGEHTATIDGPAVLVRP
jgi:exopolysaccharide production protein ExoZ